MHPHGDGSCDLPCNCGVNPCGEFLFNQSAGPDFTSWFVNEYFLGADGLANPNVSGFYIDDGWANTSQPILPWMPAEGFCDHSPIGGATEEDLHCVDDMGLVQSDTTAITDAWRSNMEAVESALQANGGWAWSMFTSVAGAPNQSECANWFRSTGPRYNTSALFFQWTNSSAEVLPAVPQDTAAFLLVRGPYAWVGYAWLGCTSDSVPGFGKPWPYVIPDLLNSMDVGTPLGPYGETAPGSGVFTRRYTGVTVSFDCNTWTPSFTPTA
jgi:hypothetical protein